MEIKYRIINSIFFLAICSNALSQKINVEKVILDVQEQTETMLREIPIAQKAKYAVGSNITPGSDAGELLSPRTLANGRLILVTSKDWTSGFFAGQLWLLHQFTGKKDWRETAERFTATIENEKSNGSTHDMGFKINSSFGRGYQLTHNAHYRDVIIEAAKTLSARFSPVTGVIKSWDNRTKWAYPVIIDNMMNLELLFEATKLTHDSTYYKIAVSHALTTIKNHFRADYSSYHVVDYDSLTGQVIKKTTHQGFSDESAWARGQDWGLYGFTMCYRETQNKVFLEQAEHIANFILHHPNLPHDKVPYWDFNAPNIPNEPRDASAAAIMASALYELSLYDKKNNGYKDMADEIMQNLTNKYRSPIRENKGFVLLHSTGSKPSNGEVDVPINYGDYYYLEALMRMDRLGKNKPIF